MCCPGTGKTTVARRVGRLFHRLGILAGPEVVECSASDFTTGYVGQSSGVTRKKFEEALGQVLFIDEAYRWVIIHCSFYWFCYFTESKSIVIAIAINISQSSYSYLGWYQSINFWLHELSFLIRPTLQW